MIVKSFWFFAALFLGIATHLATVLFLPSLNFNQNLEKIIANKPSNQFFLLDHVKQQSLLTFASPKDIIGMCQVDVEKTHVTLSAKLPTQLWSLAIYDQSGQQVYGINDVDAGPEGFSVELSKTKTLYEELFGAPDVENTNIIRNIGWRAQLSQNKAVAILWMPVPDQNRRQELETAMREVTCHPI